MDNITTIRKELAQARFNKRANACALTLLAIAFALVLYRYLFILG